VRDVSATEGGKEGRREKHIEGGREERREIMSSREGGRKEGCT
jgi:hypothetical protein